MPDAAGGAPQDAYAITEADQTVSHEPDANGVVEVFVTLDEFEIRPSLSEFETGTTYRLVLVNEGSIGHDFRVLPAGASDQGHTSGEHEHGNELLLVHEPDLQPGAVYTTEIVFREPGEIEFACHVPGHLEAGMRTNVTVTGEPAALPTAIDPASIVFDPVSMADAPCHRMGLTIMGACTDEDVARIKGEILAENAAARGELPGGDGTDEMHDEGHGDAEEMHDGGQDEAEGMHDGGDHYEEHHGSGDDG